MVKVGELLSAQMTLYLVKQNIEMNMITKLSVTAACRGLQITHWREVYAVSESLPAWYCSLLQHSSLQEDHFETASAVPQHPVAFVSWKDPSHESLKQPEIVMA